MAITKVGAMTDPPVAGDYAILQAKLDAYAKQIGNQGMILTQWTNTTTAPKIAMGSYITHGGTLFIVDTEDFAVPAPAGDGIYYLKVAVSGDTLAVSWVASTAGYAWNAIYNGLYHADESQILPYQLVKAGETLTKRKITNLMQGSGFVTVDWTGAITGSGPIVATSLDTGQGANEIYKLSREDIDFGSGDQNITKTISPMISYEMRIIFIKGTITGGVGVRNMYLNLPSDGSYYVGSLSPTFGTSSGVFIGGSTIVAFSSSGEYIDRTVLVWKV